MSPQIFSLTPWFFPSHHPGAGLVSGEAAHPEDSTWRPDAVRPSAVRLPGGQERRREEEGPGRSAHLHDAPGLRQDAQGHREAQGTETDAPLKAFHSSRPALTHDFLSASCLPPARLQGSGGSHVGKGPSSDAGETCSSGQSWRRERIWRDEQSCFR